VETIGSKRSYALTWCMPNNDDDDVFLAGIIYPQPCLHTYMNL